MTIEPKLRNQVGPVSKVARTVAGGAAIFAIATLLSRILGFGRWVAFSGTVGSTCVGEAYATANVLPNVLFEVVAGGSLAAVVVPLVSGALGENLPQKADEIASALLTWTLVVLIPVGGLLYWAAEPIGQWMLGHDRPGVSCGQQASVALAVVFIKFFAPQVPLYGVAVVLGGILQGHNRFLGPAIAPLFSSVVVIGAYLGYLHSGVDPLSVSGSLPLDALWWLAGGTTLGVVALSLPLFIPVGRLGVRLRIRWKMPPGTGRRAFALVGAGAIAFTAQQIAILAITRVHDQRGGAGAVNVFNYVQAIYLLPYAILAVPVATASFRRLAQQRGSGDHAGAQSTLRTSLQTTVWLGAAGSALLVAVAQPIGSFFAHIDASSRQGQDSAVNHMGAAIVAFAPGVLALGIVALLSRVLYVHGAALQAGIYTALGWIIAAVSPMILLSAYGGSRRVLITVGVSWSAGMLLSAALLWRQTMRVWKVKAPSFRIFLLVFLSFALSSLVHSLVPKSAGVIADLVTTGGATIVFGLSWLALAWLIDRQFFVVAMKRVAALRPQ